MEVDRIFYIFGSFSRRKVSKSKDKRKSLQLSQNSISAGNSPLHHRISQPCQTTLDIPPRTSAYGDRRKSGIKEWQCGLCGKELVEPRLLGCLHSFCTRCLLSLHREGEVEVWNDVDVGSIQLEAGGSGSTSGAGSAGSGYESELRDHSGSERSWGDGDKPHKTGIFTRKISGKSVLMLACPTCGQESQLPLGGVSALPLNYVLLRRMLCEDDGRSSVLCDLCNTDNKAESRCNQCLVSVCDSCSQAHGRQKATSRHSLYPIDTGPVRYCSLHTRAELSVYCATCQQVVCRDCCIISHSGHALTNASRAAEERARLLRDACERAKHLPHHLEEVVKALSVQEMEVDARAMQIEAEVSAWSDQYRRAVEAHGRALGAAASRARQRYRQQFVMQQNELYHRARQAEEAVKFAEEVLSEAKEEELLSLSGPVLRRLETVCEVSSLSPAPRCELRFAANAPAVGVLVGRLLTRAPDANKCRLTVDGLQDLRVDCNHESILELRDSNGERIWCGGEQVAGYYRRKDSSAIPYSSKVTDRNDGTYSLVICPPTPGAYFFAVTLNNQPIAGSPFPCAVRVAKAHSGQYHSCSSGIGTLGQSNKGCGHASHPGAKHWSCCGHTDRRSQCTKTNSVYHFSL